jgi:hypothetical protein
MFVQKQSHWAGQSPSLALNELTLNLSPALCPPALYATKTEKDLIPVFTDWQIPFEIASSPAMC